MRIVPTVLVRRIQTLERLAPAYGAALNERFYYVKPRYVPWSNEVWAFGRDVMLPWRFNLKSERQQVHDLFIAAWLLRRAPTPWNWLELKSSIWRRREIRRAMRYDWRTIYGSMG